MRFFGLLHDWRTEIFRSQGDSAKVEYDVKMKRIEFLLIVLVGVVPAACSGNKKSEPDTPEADAPVIQSITPDDGTELTSDALTVKFTFDQNVKMPDASKVKVDNGAAISSAVAYNKDVTVNVTGLEKGVSYTLTIAEGAISGFKQNPAAAITYRFSRKADEADYDRNPASSLTNSNASSSAKKLYSFLLDNYGKKSLSGAMGGTAWETTYADLINTSAGKYLAVVGFDYIFLNWPAKAWSECPDYGDITPVKNAWAAGSIIQIGWHWSVPSVSGETDLNNYGFYASGKGGGSGETTFDINEALKEGTWQRSMIDSQIEKLAGYMKLLKDAGIPVLFRPLHEAAGDYTWGAWFWWGNGGADACVKLWKYLRDKLENTYGLDNLIWVWTVQTSNAGKLCTDLETARTWYPGDEYVDMVGADLYVSKGTTQSAAFKFVNNSVKGKKMVVLSEFGNLLDIDGYFSEDAPWGYFMSWCNYENGTPVLYCKNSDGSYSWNNTVTDWKSALSNSKVINRDGVKY